MLRAPRWFAPGAGARLNFRGVRWTVYASGAFGSYVGRTISLEFVPDGMEVDTVDTHRRVSTLMIGVAWEAPFRDPRRRVPVPDRRPPPVARPVPDPH
jgi:hypothetical protein